MSMFHGTEMARDDRIYQEAAALWRQLYGEPPPAMADGRKMLDQIMKALPEAKYDRLRTPHLRPTNISVPKRA